MLYTADVPATIGALLSATEALAVEPANLMVRRPTPGGRLPGADRPGAAGLTAMRALVLLTIANVRSFVRDRAALFWTLAFPVVFVVLFGSIFSGGDSALQARLGRPGRHAGLAGHCAPASPARGPLKLDRRAPRTTCLARCKQGKVDAVLVMPAGFGAAFGSTAGDDRSRRCS